MLPERHAASYQAYLLRLWRAGGGWRASLIDPHTSQQQAFPRLEALFAFLTNLTRDLPEPADRLVDEPPTTEPAKDWHQPHSVVGTAPGKSND